MSLTQNKVSETAYCATIFDDAHGQILRVIGYKSLQAGPQLHTRNRVDAVRKKVHIVSQRDRLRSRGLNHACEILWQLFVYYISGLILVLTLVGSVDLLLKSSVSRSSDD